MKISKEDTYRGFAMVFYGKRGVTEGESGPGRGEIITVGNGAYDEHIDFRGKPSTVRFARASEATVIGMVTPKTAPPRLIFNNAQDADTKIDGAFGADWTITWRSGANERSNTSRRGRDHCG